ncbi:hypothetical protein [Actinoplanes sp. NPDC051851]|uniref:hypothetical protein n=1 Tax=Actinoplanes sp. NPDC051851 TaxID=3154753 RepID=UPI00341DF649
MTEIAMRTEQAAAVETYRESSIARLQAWAEQAVAVRQMAEGICSTSFAPKAYRGKPDEATAAILAGAELGLDPMASLRAFDDLMGTPAPKAITLRAVVLAAGHKLRIVEANERHCIIEGLRLGDTEWQRREWTIDRAARAGYVAKNPKWKTDPEAMLVARATSEMARWIASDAIMGMPYAAEELADAGAETTPITRRVSAADIVGTAVQHAVPSATASLDQIELIRTLFTRHEDTIAPGTQRAFVATVIGHDLDQLTDLTVDEADKVIDAIDKAGDQA